MRIDRVTEGSGAGIVVRSLGAGPGIVLIHTSGATGMDYRRLARALAERFTVHLYNRRGRPDAPPALHGRHTLATDIADLAVVLERTGARNVFGHSGGAFVALRAALSLPLARVGVYDPTIPIDGCLPPSFIDPFEAAVRAGDRPRALAIMSQGLRPDAGSRVPFGLRMVLARAFLRTPIGRRFGALLPTMAPEMREIRAHTGPATDYAAVTADVLLASGADSPAYFARICDSLARQVPAAEAIVIPRSSHHAANAARTGFVRPFASFFAGSSA